MGASVAAPRWSSEELHSFLARNGFESPLDLPRLDHPALKALEWPDGDRATHVEAAQTYRRLHNLGASVELSERLQGQGILSASQIAAMPLAQFERVYARSLGLSAEEAATLHRRAVRVQNRVLHLLATVNGVAQPHFRATRINHVAEDVVGHFEDLPSYQEMFGSLDYCSCDECKSIFGPAAYLVDLLRIVDERITNPNKDTIPKDLTLAKRRPDIEMIPLTCSMTNDLVPYLRIADERLLATAAMLLGLAEDQVLPAMATTLVFPVALPANVFLEQIRALLEHSRLSLGAVFATWGVDPTDTVHELLGLSPERAGIVLTVTDSPEAIAAFYGTTPAELPALADLQTFMASASLTVSAVEELIVQHLSPAEIGAGVPQGLFVNQGAGKDVLTLSTDENGKTTITNLTNGALDRLNRLGRLAVDCGWSPSEVDWALRAARAGAAPVIDDLALSRIERMRAFATRFDLTPAQVATLFGPIKTYGKDGRAQASLFDQLFNSASLTSSVGTYRPVGNPLNALYTSSPLGWQPGAAADVAALNRVLPGLGLTFDAATSLGRSLFGDKQQQLLDVSVLSSLYRHALMSRCLNLPIDQYLGLLSLLGLSGRPIFDGADVDLLLSRSDWMVGAGLDVPLLAYTVQGAESVYVDPLLDPAEVAPWLPAVVAAVPPSTPDVANGLDAQIAIFLGTDAVVTSLARTMAVAAIPPVDSLTWEQAFLAPIPANQPPPHLAYVQDVLQLTARWLAFTAAAEIPVEVMACVTRHPTSFGLSASFTPITIDILRDVADLASFIGRYNDRRGGFIKYMDLSVKSPSELAAVAALATATGWDPNQITELLTTELSNVPDVVERLRRLDACFVQARALGSDVDFMRGLTSLAGQPATSSKYASEAGELLTKLSATLGPEAWSITGNEVQGDLSGRERDPLLAVVEAGLHKKYSDIDGPEDVWEFLLTDVTTGPEAQISYVREALNAVQLYLSRCRLRIEPGVENVDIPEAWWRWILDYRRWEANRRIFVYPENYLLPSLRADRTRLFRDLEDALQQSEVTADYVQDAYAAYLQGLLSVSQLAPVDAFSGTILDKRRGGPAEAFYLFARTATEPATFFVCRRLDGGPWSEWEEIGLTIPSLTITPVYAFDKLFIFWVQLKELESPAIKLSDGDVTTTYNRTARATIQYSFQDTRGRWAEPQTLTQDALVDFEGRGQDAVPLASNPLFAGAYDMGSLAWRKVLALSVARANFASGVTSDPDAERLVVFYGDLVNDVPGAVAATNGAAPDNPDALAFSDDLRARAANHNRLVTARSAGCQGAGGAFVLDAWLESDILATRNDTILLDPYWPATSTEQYRVDVNDVAGAVQLVPSANPLVDQHVGDERRADAASLAASINSAYFVRPGIAAPVADEIFKALKTAGAIGPTGKINRSALPGLDLYAALADLLSVGTLAPLQLGDILDVLLENAGAPMLFSSVDSHRGRAVLVKGLPGTFVLDNGDEALLLSPLGKTDMPPYSSLQEGLVAAPPPLHAGSFTMPEADPPVTYETSTKIFTALGEFGYVDADGFVDLPMMRKHSRAVLDYLRASGYITEDQEPLVTNIALNYPVTLPDAFVGGRVGPALSEQIYMQLQTYSIVDDNGRVDLDFLTARLVAMALAVFVVKNQLTYDEIRAVYRKLAETPATIALSYQNRRDPGTVVEDGRFEVTRLTTAAVPRLERILATTGIHGLLDLRTQNIPVVPVVPFARLSPDPSRVDYPSALDATQVDFDGLYGRYFWELFFHGPILVATSLAASQRHRDAIAWFQYVFDPTAKESFVTADLISAETDARIAPDLAAKVIAQLKTHDVGSSPAPILSPEGRVNPNLTPTSDLSFLATDPGLDELQVTMIRNILRNEQLATSKSRFWRFRPFRTHTLESLKDMLTDKEAIRTYDDEPFDPFAIARLRIGAFEKATVMQYVDALLQWGDQYFAQDTWESITAAAMLYLYAFNLLGPRPQQVGICRESAPKNFADIRDQYAGQGGIPQFLIYLESSLPAIPDHGPPPTAIQDHAFNDLGAYFCVPENSVLTGYWDRIEDRLYKIRHSLDLEGRARALALFEPPLDPLALARAAAAANDVVPPHADTPGDVPPVRFPVALQRARSLAASVSALGGQILGALERSDGEALSLLQTTQQAQLLTLTNDLRKTQLDNSLAVVTSLQATLAAANDRASFYGALIDVGLISSETTNLEATASALAFNIVSSVLNVASSIGYAVPQVGSPFAMTYGGKQFGAVLQAAAAAAQIGSEISSYVGQRALTMATYERRAQEWQLQLTLAQRDVEGITAQLDAARKQVAAAQQEMAINTREIAQNQQLDQFLRSKFSNRQLYQWMAGRLSALHYQTYLLALHAARAAQTAYQFEFHRSDTFLDTDVWDGARKGLVAGEALILALDRMEAAAATSLPRSLEIERVISLGQLDPMALDALKTTGTCSFELPELLFDYDYPGHYARQIKSISMSIPAIVGPYENVKATLTQMWNAVALDPSEEAVKWLMGNRDKPPPASVRPDWGGRQQVALSRGVDDTGQFILDFDDPRFLPFEGTGVVSLWTMEMTPQANRFDFHQLSDVIVTVRYTALSSTALAPKVRDLLAKAPLEVGYYVDARQSYPIEWDAFMRNHSDPATQTLQFDFDPRWAGALKSLTLSQLALRLDARLTWPATPTRIGTVKIGERTALPLTIAGGFGVISDIDLPRSDFAARWAIEFDLAAIEANPDLRPLLSNGWMNPDVLLDLEVMDVCEAEVY